VLRRIAELAQARGLTAIVAIIDQALAQDRKALELDAQRRTAGPEQVRDKDLVVDRVLVAIDYLLAYAASKPDGAAATQLQRQLFPSGTTEHTRLPFPEQSSANDRVLAILEDPANAAQIAALNLNNLTADLRQARDAFDSALAARDRFNPTTWDEVKAARAAGQELYLQVVVQILAQFPGQSADDAEARATLLGPVWQQEDQVRAFRRQRRGPLLDVDPQSGELLETDGDTPVEAETTDEPSAAM
jgi:hypothetical protein